jgi:hypothetical protein
MWCSLPTLGWPTRTFSPDPRQLLSSLSKLVALAPVKDHRWMVHSPPLRPAWKSCCSSIFPNIRIGLPRQRIPPALIPVDLPHRLAQP